MEIIDWDKVLGAVDKVDAIEELQNTKCQLRHPDPNEEVPFATDYLTVPMGFNSQHEDTLQIAACNECIDYLSSNEWVLILCIGCLASRWVYKKHAKLDYGNKALVLVDGCPNCTGKTSGVHLI